MRVDFYQLGAAPLEQVVATLARKVLDSKERLIVVADDESLLGRLDRSLWEQERGSFLPHGLAGSSDDSRQPLLLSTLPDASNRARFVLIADGKWRDSALAFHRSFYLFDSGTLEEARNAWRSLAQRKDAECHYWANVDGRWVEKAVAGQETA